MYTIYDYLRYYKDLTIKEIPWNNIDNLLLAILVYIPLKSFNETISFDEMCNRIIKCNVSKSNDYMVPKIRELIEIIKGSKRYSKMKFRNFVNQIDKETQFGAMTCIFNRNKIISFRGTDRSIIGWIENFRLMYETPTYTQVLAKEYLDKNIGFFDKKVHVVGHSKGGNLAMYSTMKLNNFKIKKVKKVVNFDGPGFMKEDYDSIEYKKMSKKLINIVPSNSYIGVLMFNNEYEIISTSAHAINVHYPIFWNTDGVEFEHEKLSNMSKELHRRTSTQLEGVDREKFKAYFEAAFKVIDYKKTSDISITFKDLINIFKTIRSLDKETSEYVITILKSMLALSNKKEGK